MTRRFTLVVLVCLVAGVVAAQEAEKKSTSSDVMQSYLEAAKPVAEHRRLASLEGKWDIAMRFWMSPAEPPMTATGTANGRLVLGGRFLQIEATTGNPIPSESITMFGFDRRTGKYTLVGFDTLGTYYVTASGKPDRESGEIALRGSYLQPPAMQQQNYRFVWTSASPAEHVLRLFFSLPDGKEMLVAETRYTKAR